MKSRCVLFTIPRSGSTLISEIISYYLRETYGFNHLPEYFALNQAGIKMVNGLITIEYNKWSSAQEFTLPVLAKQTKERVGYLKSSKHRYFFKLFPFQAGLHRKWILDNSERIFLYRENLLENLLSFMISDMTGQYYEAEGIRWKSNSLYATNNSFLRFSRIVNEYTKIRNQYSGSRALCFEEALAMDPATLMRKLGHKKSVDWSKLSLPEKQNKLLAFSNPDEILDWYRGSELNKIYPLKSSSL